MTFSFPWQVLCITLTAICILGNPYYFTVPHMCKISYANYVKIWA